MQTLKIDCAEIVRKCNAMQQACWDESSNTGLESPSTGLQNAIDALEKAEALTGATDKDTKLCEAAYLVKALRYIFSEGFRIDQTLLPRLNEYIDEIYGFEG